MFIAVFNTTDGPVAIDPDGRTLEGRGWGCVDANTQQVQEAMSSGKFIQTQWPFDGSVVDPGPGLDALEAADVANGKAAVEAPKTSGHRRAPKE